MRRWCWRWRGYYKWGAVEGKAAVLLPPAQWTRISQLGSLSATDDGPLDFSLTDALTRLLHSALHTGGCGWVGGIIQIGEKIGKIAPQDILPVMKTLCSLFLDRLLYVVCRIMLLFGRWDHEQDRTHSACRPHAHRVISVWLSIYMFYTHLRSHKAICLLSDNLVWFL